MESLADKISKKKDIIQKKSTPSEVKKDLISEDGKVVRPEYNLAKWADKIFLPHQSKRLGEKRMIPPQPQLFRDPGEDPKRDPICITITPAMGGQTGSTTTWKVLLGLFKLWEEKGKPADGEMNFSTRELAKIMGQRVTGDFATKVNREIETLVTMSLKWEYCFKNSEGENVDIVQDMHIISDRTYVSKKYRKIDTQFDALHHLCFGKYVRKNLLAGMTIPVDFETFMSIKSSTSLTLYSKLCIYLSTGTFREFRSEKLFKELELIGSKYSSRRTRKNKLQSLISILNNKPTFNGILNLSIEETNDGEDWKLVARRVGKETKVIPLTPSNNSSVTTYLTDDIIAQVGQPEHKANWRKLALTYPEDLIHQALSEYKADVDKNTLENPGKMFNAIVHRLAHQRGLEWIKSCGSDCRFRS